MLTYAPDLDRVFQALADPGRRLMVERLSRGPASVSELGQPLDMTLAAVLQHVHVLESCGLIRSSKLGRTRTGSINPAAALGGELDRRSAHHGRAPPAPPRRIPGRDRRPTTVHTRQSRATMTDRSVLHDTFSLQRTYPATPSRVFSAFASASAKRAWHCAEDELADGPSGVQEFDFRPGGRERFGVKHRGENPSVRRPVLRHRARPAHHLRYEMYADDVRNSVSVATLEFAKNGAGTTLTWTDQGVYLDGIDGTQAPVLRVGGTTEMLDGRYLAG
ncbi:MAG TPA: metalloregulator ArsR/SmtB family transcription factor [Candidatus Limnocylindrales bacterium]|nr:metalloregulator ArsR/SmtB family transcription factor [Candidatus Limnocylindrales bacterium]